MKNKLNICHIISGDLWAGAEAQAFNLVREMVKDDQVSLKVITFNNGVLVDKLRICGIETEVIDESKTNFIVIVWHIFQILKKAKVEIIHVHGFKESFLGGIAARFCGHVRIFRTFHGKGLTDSKLRYRLIEKINGIFFSDQLISVSEDLKQFLVSCGFKKSILKVVHNGVCLDDVKPTNTAEDVRRELRISDDAFVIGTLGRMVKVKGHKFFIEGAKEVVTRNPRIYFILAGDGPLMGESLDWVKKNNLMENIKIIGFRNDPYDVLNIFDVFALTSLHEGIPMVLLEAMCLGKPLITTGVGGIPEIISDRVTGIMIPPGNSKGFAAACMELIANDMLRKKLTDNCRKVVMERYTSDTVAEKVVQLYNRAL